MTEQIDTIPVNEAFDAGDECPFCYLQRKAEQSTIRYVAGPGASYMEPDVRGATDAHGFCDTHSKKLFDYGNSLGLALMLQTYYAGLLEEFSREKIAMTAPEKKGLFAKKKPVETDTYPQRLRRKVDDCFICSRMKYHMNRYYTTFFYLLKEDEFRAKVTASKGFCFKHFSEIMELAPDKVPAKQKDWFYSAIPEVMHQQLVRVKEDLDWFIAKFDYRNAAAPWYESKDAVSRSIQKLQSIYPADPPYKKD